MSLFVIEAVRFNAVRDRVEMVRWGKVRGGEVSHPIWASEPEIVDITVVVDALKAGDEAVTVFSDATGMSFGPNVRVVTHDDAEGIEAEDKSDAAPERGLRDLPNF